MSNLCFFEIRSNFKTMYLRGKLHKNKSTAAAHYFFSYRGPTNALTPQKALVVRIGGWVGIKGSVGFIHSQVCCQARYKYGVKNCPRLFYQHLLLISKFGNLRSIILAENGSKSLWTETAQF